MCLRAFSALFFIQVNLCQKLFFLQNMGENMLCTNIVLNDRNNFRTQLVLPRFELGIFMYWTCNSMNNLLSYCGFSWCKNESFWQRFTCMRRTRTTKFFLNLKMVFCPLCWCGPSALESSSRRKALCVAYTHLCTTSTYILPGHHYRWNFHFLSRNYEEFDLLHQRKSHLKKIHHISIQDVLVLAISNW